MRGDICLFPQCSSKWLHVGRQNVEAGSAVLIDLNTSTAQHFYHVKHVSKPHEHSFPSVSMVWMEMLPRSIIVAENQSLST